MSTRHSDWRSHAWLVVLMGGELFYQVVRRVALATDNPRLLPGMVLLGTLIVPVAFVTFLAGRRPHHDVTLGTALVTALAGGSVSLALAGVVESDALNHDHLSALLVGSAEEMTKFVVTAAVLVWSVPRSPRNGLIVGAACGAGFAVVETLGYAFVDYLRSGGGLDALDNDLLFRSLLSPATHMTWAALTGWALGRAMFRRWTPSAVLALIGTCVGVVLLHTTWDAFPGTAVYLLLSVLGLTSLAASLGGRSEPLVEGVGPIDAVPDVAGSSHVASDPSTGRGGTADLR